MSDPEGDIRGVAGQEDDESGRERARHLWNTRGLFPDDTPVALRYPTGREDRSVWFAGTIVGQFGPNEWEVAVDDPRLASGQEPSPLIRCGAERMRVLTDREWSDLVDEACRSMRRHARLRLPAPDF